MKFGLIAKHRGIWPARWLCEALGVSRGGFYAWLTRPRSQRSRSDEELGVKVRASFLASDRTYGARRVWRDLLAEGLSCGLHRIERLMGYRPSKHVRGGGACRPIWVSGRRPPSLPTCSTVLSNTCSQPQMDRRLHAASTAQSDAVHMTALVDEELGAKVGASFLASDRKA